MRYLQKLKHWCLQHLMGLQWVLWCSSAVMLVLAAVTAWHWTTLAKRNTAMAEPQAILALHPAPQDALWAYARGYALQASPEQALKLFYVPETSESLRLRANTKFAIGNLYFDWAMMHHNIEQGGAHQQQVAMIALAKEAYKDALRLDPGFADARFNLELLDRRSPEKRTEGWQSETDGVTLKPFKRNGTAMMRDNQRRGLP
jgi:mxaK protein